MSYQKDVVNCFQSAPKTFKTSQEWYYAVKTDNNNPHSLSCVLGLTNEQHIVALTFSITSTRLQTGGWKHTTSDVAVIGL